MAHTPMTVCGDAHLDASLEQKTVVTGCLHVSTVYWSQTLLLQVAHM